MCGISGMVTFYEDLKKSSLAFKENMLSTMGRRGPDQQGSYCGPEVLLLHSRLAVIDPENGKQPMTAMFRDNTYTIVYNGELYNCDELRAELSSLGFDFSTHSDTEVLLKSYLAFGENCPDKLNGIFAFAIWNEKKKELFFARDKMGVKPFFYAEVKGGFVFASEIKTLLAHPDIRPIIDQNSVSELILIGPGRTPGYGVFKQIKELKPANRGTYNRKGLSLSEYWKLRDGEHTDSLEETIEKVGFLVRDAIQRQLISDVPLCTFLSGGLDSSIISSVAAKYFAEKGKQLKTFSVYYKDNEKYFQKSKFQPNSDNRYIEAMTQYLGCENEAVILETPELVEALFAAVEARDLPGMADVDSSLLLFCKQVKKSNTVALSGECADEIFGGYPWYRDKTIREKAGFPWAQSTAWRASFLQDDFAKAIDAEQFVMGKYEQTARETDLLGDQHPDDRSSKVMMNLNLKWFMQTLLDRKDRMSMYSGLEVRVPFCDTRIVEYLYRVPWAFKEYDGYEKGLLRQAVKGLLPNEVLWRKKSPYPKTHHPAYFNTVKAMLSDVVSSPNEPLFDLVKRESVQKLLTSENATPWYGQLMTVPQTVAYFLQLNYWLKHYQVEIE